jgi:SnoaL-like domain
MSLTAMDYEEIRQLFARLAWNIDHGNAEAYAADFTPDGSFEVLGLPEGAEHAGRHQDRDGVAQFVSMLFAGTQGHVRHWNQNFVFTKVTDGEVDVDSYLICVRVGAVPQSGVTLTGIYHDRLVKVDGRWYMKERFIRADPQPEHAAQSTDILVVARDEFVARVPAAANV